ncbi:MAG: DNA-directed RNA polymerase subunit beta', partial [Candidatus Sumerlaeia bacterium]|nr:DNA-directed RNA polymerase subunit beta' [Candidatus Sumerlaeia bacterium]
REGLSVVEYFISTHGARKGLADTALKTSDAGYLTRRLVDVAQELIITEEDCKTFNFINQRALKELTPQGERELLKLADRIIGFVAAKDIVDPRTNQVLCKRNQLITEEIATAIIDAGLEEVPIRSVLTCEARRGICRLCYGINPATSRLVELGEAIGIIAAQSIGEPGPQLTLRTFHVGGTASRELEGWYQATADGFLKFKNLRLVKHADGYYVVVNRRGSILVQDEYGNTLQTIPTVPYGARITKNNGDPVKKDERIVEYDPHHIPIIADCDGILKFDDIIKGVTMKIEVDPITNVAQMIISEYKEERHPQLLIVDNKGEILYQYPLA